MKIKIIYITFLLVTFFFVSEKPAFAQLMAPTGIPQPGIDCGDPNAPGPINKCCKSTIYKPGAMDLGDPLLNAAQGVLMPIVEKSTNNIVQQQKSVVISPCIEGVPSTPGDLTNDACLCIFDKSTEPIPAFEVMCAKIKDPSEQTLCIDCAHNRTGAWTALGCFNGNFGDFIANNIMKTGIGIAGGISLLCIMLAAFQMQTSSGNAEKIKKAQELLTNCITGLMVIIFSILILKIIGVDILKIPGFS